MLINLTGDDWNRGRVARHIEGAYWQREGQFGPGYYIDDPTPRIAAIILACFPELVIDYPDLGVERDKLAQDVRPFDNATPLGLRISQSTTETFDATLASR